MRDKAVKPLNTAFTSMRSVNREVRKVLRVSSISKQHSVRKRHCILETRLSDTNWLEILWKKSAWQIYFFVEFLRSLLLFCLHASITIIWRTVFKSAMLETVASTLTVLLPYNGLMWSWMLWSEINQTIPGCFNSTGSGGTGRACLHLTLDWHQIMTSSMMTYQADGFFLTSANSWQWRMFSMATMALKLNLISQQRKDWFLKL